MDALLTTFLAAALSEWGDKTWLLVVALSARFGRPRAVLAGVALAALLNSLLAAGAGLVIHGYITLRAISLLVALALLFAGVAGFLRPAAPDRNARWRGGPFAASFFAFFVLEFGDKTQFVTMSLAAQFNTLGLAAAGATAGILAAAIPAALLGREAQAAIPTRGLRYAAAAIFTIAGLIVAVNALRLV